MIKNKYREKIILGMIPPNVKKVLDIGSRGDIFKDYEVTTLDIIEHATIRQDLNKNQKMNLKKNSFDLVVLNQILEHLSTCEELIDESKRVSKKYILVGLPNELTWGVRIKYLFGKIDQEGYLPYGHKHRFSIREIEKFIKKFLENYEKKRYYGAFTGANFLPDKLKDFLANFYPNLFAKEVYYLIRIK
ncbi:MAG: methionine biosynthesis protein MetW [Nanoarchaeota archaeon]